MARKRYLESTVWQKQFEPFGDRLNFLSPEARHAETGRLRILPPRGERKRDKT